MGPFKVCRNFPKIICHGDIAKLWYHRETIEGKEVQGSGQTAQESGFLKDTSAAGFRTEMSTTYHILPGSISFIAEEKVPARMFYTGFGIWVASNLAKSDFLLSTQNPWASI